MNLVLKERAVSGPTLDHLVESLVGSVGMSLVVDI